MSTKQYIITCFAMQSIFFTVDTIIIIYNISIYIILTADISTNIPVDNWTVQSYK